MGDARKGGQAVKPDSSGKAMTDTDRLAFQTYVGGDDEAAEATPDDEHAERHDYYKNLVAKQKSGKALTDAERAWMDQAVQAHHKVTRQGQLPGELSKFNVDDEAMRVFGTGTAGLPMQMPRARNIGNEVDNRVTIPEAVLFNSLDRVPQGQLKDTAHYLGRLGNGGFVNGMSQGYAKAELHPTPSVTSMQRGEQSPQPITPERDEHGNIIIRLPPDMMPEMKAPIRKDKSINPSGKNPKKLKA